ncbi:MAG: hypothetical protein AB7O44_32305 [Hyphomicrobiaceae bacterium]
MAASAVPIIRRLPRIRFLRGPVIGRNTDDQGRPWEVAVIDPPTVAARQAGDTGDLQEYLLIGPGDHPVTVADYRAAAREVDGLRLAGAL